MKTFFCQVIIVVCTLLVLQSCYYDKAELLYPDAGRCDTARVISYVHDIVPVIQKSCSPCHTTSSPDGNIILGIYASDQALAKSGRLLGSVNQQPGYSFMPKGGAKLTSCQLSILRKWIDGGAPNN